MANRPWSQRFRLNISSSLRGDRLLLPPSILPNLVSDHPSVGPQQPDPLVFEIRASTGTGKTFGTVQEFIAPEGVVVLSSFLAECLGLSSVDSNDTFVSLTRTALPRGTNVTLVPLSSDYVSLSNIRSLLESHLRQGFTTMTKGSVLTIRQARPEIKVDFLVGGVFTKTVSSTVSKSEIDSDSEDESMHEENMTATVHEKKECDAVLCINTDLEVDIQPMDQDIARDAVVKKFHLSGSGGNSGTYDIDSNEISLSFADSTQAAGSSRGLDSSISYTSQRRHKEPVYIKIANLKSSAASKSSDPVFKGQTYLAKVRVLEGDAVLFASTVQEKPHALDHEYAAIDYESGHSGSGVLVLEYAVTNASDFPFVYLTILPFEEVEISFQLEIQAIPSPRDIQEPLTENSPPESVPAGQKQCNNCGMFIPERTFVMHEAFCLRNNKKCPTCGRVFQVKEYESHWHCEQCSFSGHRSQEKKHLFHHHANYTCTCGLSFAGIASIPSHRKTCPDRLILCRFCHLTVRAGPLSTTAKDLYLNFDIPLTEHESTCGARTIPCVKCGTNVQLKEMTTHARIHDLDKKLSSSAGKQKEAGIEICANRLCANVIQPLARNHMGLCRSCFSPFWTARHDPGNTKAAQKLIRTYHEQLTSGCGKQTCLNPFCATGCLNRRVALDNDNSVFEVNADPEGPRAITEPFTDANEAAVLAIQLYRLSTFDGKQPPILSYFLCGNLELASTTRRLVAETTLMPMGFSLEWSIKSLLECDKKDNVERAIVWLLSNAPSASS